MATEENTTLGCTECSAVFEGPATGPGSAAFQRGSHMYRAHGIKGAKKKRARAGAPTDADFSERPVLSVIRDAAAEAGSGSNRKGPPSADDLTNGLGRGLGLITTAVAAYAVETDPNIPEGPEGDRRRDRLMDDLALSDKSARDVMRPVGKAVAPTKINRKFGRQVVENVDVAASIAELFTLGLHWRRYFRERATGVQEYSPYQPTGGPIIDVDATPPAGPEAPPAPPPPGQQYATPPPSRGVILTPEMIRHRAG